MRVRDLSSVERRVWEAFGRGRIVDLRVGDAVRDDPANSGDWGSGRTVRAEVLAMLLLGGKGAEPGRVPSLRLAGALIEGELDLEYAEVPHRIRLTGCHIPRPVKLYNVRARHITVEDSRLVRVLAANAVIDGSLRLSGCRVEGQVLLDGAHIVGVLNLNGTRVSNPGGVALSANRIEVDDHIWIGEGFAARGEVTLRAARVGGDVDLHGTQFSNPGGLALVASRMRVEGGVLCGELEAHGEVRIRGAVIAGDVYFDDARLTNPGGTAFEGYRLQIGGGLHLKDVAVEGGVRLTGAEITTLLLGETTITAPGSIALDLWQARMKQLDLRTAEPVDGLVDLRHAEVGILHDDPRTWPRELKLDGLAYQRLATPLSAQQRVHWLLRDTDGYAPQAFEQLAQAFRTLGHENEARTVLLAKERLRHRTLPWYARVWGAVQDATVGYGYRPMRAGLWLLALLAAGSAVFATHHPVHTSSNGTLAFNPVIFTLDQLLPVVGFGQSAAFTPTPGTQWVGYVMTAAGWILATTIATGVTRSVNRP